MTKTLISLSSGAVAHHRRLTAWSPQAISAWGHSSPKTVVPSGPTFTPSFSITFLANGPGFDTTTTMPFVAVRTVAISLALGWSNCHICWI
jgi:hypothetical protein